MERNTPENLKKMHCFEQLAVYLALYLGSMVSDNNIFCRKSTNAFSEQTAAEKTSLPSY